MSAQSPAVVVPSNEPQCHDPQPDQPQPVPRPLSRTNLIQTLAAGYVPLVLTTLVVFLPLLWMVLSSFKQPGEIVTTDLKILPDSLNLENYATAMTTVPFAQFFANSLVVTTVGSTIKVVLAILTAYALVFVRFPFKNVIFVLILVALMVPAQVSILPNYILVAGMGGKNTLWGIILPGLGTAFGTFLLRQHFLTLPPSILEAAEIDGAGHWRRLWQIIVPVSLPSVATVALVTVVSEWNDYIWPLIITDRPETMTLPVGLTLLQNSEGNGAGWGILMAGAVLVIVPILLVFAALQRYIVAGLTQGSVTG
ncbi:MULTISPECIES: carbohydrate ABC transporter permease [Paenarthrobacter]|uniref:Carbohydrate ABC transporter permease n=1 Tax=Paenarthrobacter ureafaciens TaxID=37931 RepID=A0AAX3EEW5_PAEUR|nr:MULTISPECIES: carbohydrate ABC transporter permease [Paenarthrobacter]NKR10062.1 glycerol-3-phosphate ABC transporter permease [Arthrobacter sp. M5]NKR14635.1 glycerol-3-phosphate ABC transporter permease [Arthrobacter sp. M6]OEH60217.1 glycerol-3-phosphate ABC transporter permease [Arthrobacter sp. D4]OEH60832.1 glycerol-3-phosphate ABC transporter permease [Arthrobacter sp. D2]MDO5865668.1 carbohydrate ABC transporter permease [Paenarthrobacter sp. SD-2]